MEPEAIRARVTTLTQEAEAAASSKDRAQQQEALHKRLLIGYSWERSGEFSDAETNYRQAARGMYGSVALFRLAQMAEYQAEQARAQAEDSSLSQGRRQEATQLAQAEQTKAIKALEQVYNSPTDTKVLLREPTVASLPLVSWDTGDLRYQAYERLDGYYRSRTSYRAMAFLVKVCGGGGEAAGKRRKSYPYILAIILIAALAKLITTPLTAAQFKSMRAMQAVQPELKKLQEKYKDDKAALGRAQMELFREHKVNPASSCLPMLIQFPVLIWVYYAIRYYVFQFEGVRFLYIGSLADPDVLTVNGLALPGPLLVLYGVSMYFSQKLLAQPSATPEQQQQQKMMAYMMPVFLLLILKSLPAAFILYWLLQNVLMTGHQWLIMRAQPTVAVAAAGGPSGGAPAPPAPSGPPPQAIQKLSQGSASSKKKKRR